MKNIPKMLLLLNPVLIFTVKTWLGVCVCVRCFHCLLFQSTFVNRPALGILPPENFGEKLMESLLTVGNV